MIKETLTALLLAGAGAQGLRASINDLSVLTNDVVVVTNSVPVSSTNSVPLTVDYTNAVYSAQETVTNDLEVTLSGSVPKSRVLAYSGSDPVELNTVSTNVGVTENYEVAAAASFNYDFDIQSDGEVKIWFNTVSGKTYTVYGSDDLSKDFKELVTMSGNGRLQTYSELADGVRGFYKVVEE